MSNVLLCANEPILAEGLRRILENVPGLELAGCCPRLEDLREQVETIQPDILLVDLTADVTFSVLSGLREAVSTSRIVLWVHAISTELALQSMSLGVRGILRRTLPVETLVRCLQRVEEGVDKPRPKVLFEPGQVVRVVHGPFNDFNGVVESVNYEKNRLQVAVQILGRSTPVELDFSQVEKV